MTVSVSKPSLNLREELSALKKPSGIKGEELLRSNSISDVYGVIGQNRNIVINGAMEIAQRSTSVSGLLSGNSGYYTIDRFAVQNGGNGTFRITYDQASDAPPGFTKSAKLTVTTPLTGANSPTSYCGFFYVAEGYDCNRLGWGSSNPKPLTISFWVKASVVGTYTHVGVRVDTVSGTYSCFTNIDINAANVWEYKTVTIPGLSVALSNKTNGVAVQLHFNTFAGVGGAGTASNLVWQNVNALGTGAYVNDTRWIGTSGATFQITGVQAEVGSVATPFEYRSYQQELAMCHRYFLYAPTPAFVVNTGNVFTSFQFPVPMRAAPTLTVTPTSGTATLGSPSSGVYGFHATGSATAGTSVTASSEL